MNYMMARWHICGGRNANGKCEGNLDDAICYMPNCELTTDGTIQILINLHPQEKAFCTHETLRTPKGSQKWLKMVENGQNGLKNNGAKNSISPTNRPQGPSKKYVQK